MVNTEEIQLQWDEALGKETKDSYCLTVIIVSWR